jgi:hypothetical protein
MGWTDAAAALRATTRLFTVLMLQCTAIGNVWTSRTDHRTSPPKGALLVHCNTARACRN